MKTHVLVYCLVGGLPVTIAALGAGHFGWWWLSGILFAGSFVPAALFGPRNVVGQFAVIAPVLLIVTVLCTYCAWAAPLAVSNALMGTRQRLIHTVENLHAEFLSRRHRRVAPSPAFCASGRQPTRPCGGTYALACQATHRAPE